MTKGKERTWKPNEETRQKFHANVGFEDIFERPLKNLSLVIHI